ncbi:hypothetical protein [Streptomyces atratus]|uniref:hypothetical protein n=1 Tax=Streptomyces atratus TaxID=1893 RepID=UPI0021A83DF6|nr:hypothetical protein [Streptomyces atratus]MCT2546980.1 hypothetical protein [Streptomyces atratus]
MAVGILGALVLGGCAGGGRSSHPSPSASVVGKATLFPSDSGGGGGQGDGSGIGFPAVKVGESADTAVEMKNNEQRTWEHDKPTVAGDGEDEDEGDGVQGTKADGTSTASEATGDGHNVYLIVEDHCGDDPILPGQSCTFKIRFIRGSNDAPPAALLEIDSPTWPIRAVVTAASKPGVTPNTVPSGLETSGPAVSPGTTGPTGPTESQTDPGESPVPQPPTAPATPGTEPGSGVTPPPQPPSEPPTAPATPGTEPGGGVTPPPQPATPGTPAT